MVGWVCRRRWLLCGLAVFGASGCGEAPREHVGRSVTRLAHPGPWDIPDEVLAIGDSQHVEYTGAGPWVGESGCYGGISPATDILRDYLYAHFPQTHHIGGYACRPIVGNESKMSVHATGRALDIMIETVEGEADNDLGDPIGNWLIVNAEAIGIQFIIWDLYTWMAARDPGSKGKDYGGAHPHDDHLHIELAEDYADLTYNWFEDLVEAPVVEGCDFLAPEGGVVEETSACFGAFGPNEYWRVVEGAGHGSSLLWTNAFENDAPSNWARWHLYLQEAGTYRVEIYVDPDHGVHRDTLYELKHGEELAAFSVDQSADHGWVSLGEFLFEEGGGQHLSVFDHTLAPVEEDQRIAVDAVRLTRLDGGADGSLEPTWPDGEQEPTVDDGASSPRLGGEDGGCSLGAARPDGRAGGSWLAVIGLGLACRRRRRARR